MLPELSRQQKILNLLVTNPGLSASQTSKLLKVGLRTLQRDLNQLADSDLIEKVGSGSKVSYKNTLKGHILLQPELGLLKDSRLETTRIIHFNFDIFEALANIEDLINEDNYAELAEKIQNYKSKSRINNLSTKREFERLIIEFAWKSSQIEGNTYSLLETEELLSGQIIPKSKHSLYETQMILNHKTAFEFILQNKDYFYQITPAKIQELHSLLIQGLDIYTGYRKSGVGITGSLFKPLDNQYQISEAITNLCDLINTKPPLVKGLLAGLLVSYIQPFLDGNKRTARMLSNAILYSNDLPMLSFRSVSIEDYRSAMISFYEYNSIYLYKKLYLSQIQYFLEAYF